MNKLGFSKRSFSEFGKDVKKAFQDGDNGLQKFSKSLKAIFVPFKDIKKIVKLTSQDFNDLFNKDELRFFDNFNKSSIKASDALDERCAKIKVTDNTLRSYLVDCMKNDIPASFDGYNKYVEKAISNNKNFSLSAKLASAGMKLLAVGGNLVASWAIGEAINFAVTQLDNWINAEEKAKEKLENLEEAYKENTSKLEVLNTELSTTAERIKELEESPSFPTLVEKEELENLKAANELLEAKIRLQQLEQKESLNELADESYEQYRDTKSNPHGYFIEHVDSIYNARHNTNSDPFAIESANNALYQGYKAAYVAELRHYQEQLVSLEKQFNQAVNDDDTELANSLKKKMEDTQGEVDKYKTILMSYLEDLYKSKENMQNSIDFGGINDFEKSKYTDAISEINEIVPYLWSLIDPDYWRSQQEKYLLEDDAIKKAKEDAIEYAKSLKDTGITVDMLTAKFSNLVTAYENVGIAAEELASDINKNAGIELIDPEEIESKLSVNIDTIAMSKSNAVKQQMNAEGLVLYNDPEIEYSKELERLSNYTDKLTIQQKNFWLTVTNGSADAEEAISKFEQAYYANNRDQYLADHDIAINFTNPQHPTQQDIENYNNLFEDFVRSLSDEDYQILLSLNVAPSMTLDEIEQQIRDSKDEIQDILSQTFKVDEDDNIITIEDEVTNIKSHCDEIKGYLDDLNENGFENLSADALTAIEKIAPGFSEYLSDAENKTAAAIEFLTKVLGEQDDALVSHLEYLMGLNNFSDGSLAYVENLLSALDRLAQYSNTPDYGGLLTQYKSGADLDDMFYTFDDDKAISYATAVDEVNSRLSTLTDAYQKLWEYELQIGEASNDIDSAEFTQFVTDLIQQFPELAQYFDGTINSISGLKAAVASMADVEPNAIVSALEDLRNTEGITDGLRTQIDLLIESFQNLSNIDASMSTTKNVISDMRTDMQNLAELTHEINANGFTLDVEAVQKFGDLFPELLINATHYADGRVKLDEEVAKNFIASKKAEIHADGDARKQELQNQIAVYTAERAYAQAKLQAVIAALQSGSIADYQVTINSIENADLAKKAALESGSDQVDANKKAMDSMGVNYDALNTLVGTVSTDTSTNMDRAAYNSAQSVYENALAIQESLVRTGEVANDLARAIDGSGRGEVVSMSGVHGASSGRSRGASVVDYHTNAGILNTKGGDSVTDSKNTGFWSALGNYFNKGIDSIKDLAEKTGANNYNLLQGYKTQFESEIAEYDSLINEAWKQIEMIDANGGIDVDAYVANLAKGLGSSAGSSGSVGSGGSSGGSSSANDFIETIDWIETAIERIEYGIESLDKIAANAYNKFSDRNTALVAQLEQTRNEIDLQKQAYLRYMLQAESVGLSDFWKQKVQRGEVNIEDITNEALADQISSYTEW